jgi:enoyl-[acyl-carrier protein] reductase II
MALTVQVARAVAIPVIAAGGVADGRGMLAAFALGAEGVQLGTRFVCAKECNAHDNFKKKIIDANDRSTVVTGRRLGHPVRCIKNKFTQMFTEMEDSHAEMDELDKLGSGRLRAAVVDGDMENGSAMSGQIAGLVGRVQPAREIIQEVVDEAARLAREIGSRFD